MPLRIFQLLRNITFLFPCMVDVFELSTSKNYSSRDSVVVITLRCGHNNPGSNPGHGNANIFFGITLVGSFVTAPTITQ